MLHLQACQVAEDVTAIRSRVGRDVLRRLRLFPHDARQRPWGMASTPNASPSRNDRSPHCTMRPGLPLISSHFAQIFQSGWIISSARRELQPVKASITLTPSLQLGRRPSPSASSFVVQ